MGLGDISFIAAFIVLPLVIVVLSVVALRTLSRRQQRRPLARFSADTPTQTTQELPLAEPAEPRDWAASVRPTRGPVAGEMTKPVSPERSFKVPSYRGRTKGVVRRMSFQSRPIAPAPRPETREEANQPQE